MVVVDALDECADERDTKIIVALLSQLAKEVSFGLKSFIASRPEIATNFALNSFGHVQEIILQEVTEHVIDEDIRTYLSHELSKVRNKWNQRHRNITHIMIPKDWPEPQVLNTLVKVARPLFIFAATVCRFVNDY